MENLKLMTLKELIGLLRKETDAKRIDEKREEIARLMPKVRIMFDFDQRNQAHQYDLWLHCIHTVTGLPRDLDDDMIYLGALLHDIGKPDCQTRGRRADDEDMHYYGHPKRSMEIVRDEVIPGLLDQDGFGKEDARRLIYYVEHHDDRMSVDERCVNAYFDKGVSLEEFRNLMHLQVADALAHVQIPIVAQRVEKCRILSGAYACEVFRKRA